MSGFRNFKGELPDWTKALPDHALIDSADMCRIFGYSNASSLNGAIEDGRLPQPSHFARRIARTAKRQWRLGVVRKLVKQAVAA